MMLVRVMICAGLIAMFGGCAVYTPGAAIVIDPAGAHHGGFCPPGQAKKGNC